MIYSPPQPPSTQEDAWWVQQWVDLLNSYRFKKRLERGRNYARQGHILSLEFKNSKVHATVQGTAQEPYKLSIWIERFTDEDWGFVIDTLAKQARYSAQLLAGEMPDDIESVFTANGLSLFPFTLADVSSKCSCPDPKNPCKHIAAVYYQLGDFFREDPFVLFQLRGRTKEQILEALRQHRQQALALQLSADTSGDKTDIGTDARTDIKADAEIEEEAVEADEKSATKTKATKTKKSKTTKSSTAQADTVQADTARIGSAEEQSSTIALATPQSAPALQIETFWQYDQPIDPSLVVITPAAQTVLDVLGDMPLAATEAQAVMAHFKDLYQAVAQQAMMTALS
jgi:uncharacterized Zn finger protein